MRHSAALTVAGSAPAKKHPPPARRAPAPPVTVAPVSNRSLSTLQRKAQCACGGGCPSCEQEQSLQPKLKVSQAGDALEQEADRVAEQVTNGSAVSELSEGGELRVSRVAEGAGAEVHAAPALVHDVLRSGGEPLGGGVRTFMEPRFGYDLSGVRVHTDARAAESARAVNALAYTVGRDIVFGAGQYAPETSVGRKLLAHELSHAIQQQAVAPRGAADVLEVSHPADAPELEAEAAAESVAGGRSVALRAGTGVRLARQVDERQQAERRQSEIEILINEMTSVLSGINVVGAEVEFLFWTSHGAITLVNYRQTQQGSTAVRPFTAPVLDEFAAAERRTLPTFIGTSERYIQITMRRTRSSWVQQSFAAVTPQGLPPRPPEGRTMPLSRQGYGVEIYSRSSDVASAIVRHLQVPPNGTAELVATVEYEDDRIVSWSPNRYQASVGQTRGAAVPVAPDFSFEIHTILLPLTSGLGRRTVRMVLRGRHASGDAHSTWQVAEAGVVRPAAPGGDEAGDIVREYRQTHERIIAEWRQGVRDAGVMVAMFGARELAFWLIGGVVLRVFGAGIRAVAPTLFRLISPGTRAAGEFLETLIVRMLPAERAEFRALAAKAETEGLGALTAAERARLDSLLGRLEQLISAPISDAEKGYLRTAMHGRYQAARAAEVAAFQAAGRAYQVHHRLPLEYGHLITGLDVNAAENLIGLDVTVHRGVNAVWTRFRTVPAGRVTPDAVRRVAEIVDRHFMQWYDNVPATDGLAASVEVAKDAARVEVDALIRVLSP